MDFINILMDYAYIWAPSLTSVFAILALIIKGLSKVDDAVNTLKDNKAIISLKESVRKQIEENTAIGAELEKAREELKSIKKELVCIEKFASDIKSAEELLTSVQRSDVEANHELLQKINIILNAMGKGGAKNEGNNEKA